MMGGQGVGKGTFSRMLAARHDFNHIEVGALLRAMPADCEIAKTISAGNLVPDDMLFDLMRKKITPDRDIILDGFPRKLSQAKWLVKNYADKFDIHVIYLNVPESVLVERINKRIREGVGRADDADPAVIRRRLDNYRQITVPAIEWLRNTSKVRFYEIDVTGDVDSNFMDITAVLGL